MSYDIQKKLSLKAESQFAVMSERNMIILKTTTPPPMADFDELITEARKKAKQARLKKSDIQKAIVSVREKK